MITRHVIVVFAPSFQADLSPSQYVTGASVCALDTPGQEGNKLQRRNSKFYKPLKKKKFRNLSFQPDLRGSNDLRVGRKMATFQSFFQSGRYKDLSAPPCMLIRFRTVRQTYASKDLTTYAATPPG